MLDETVVEKDINLEHADVCVSIVEEEYLSVEFFPNNQTKESFESAEFNTIVRISDILDNKNLPTFSYPKDCVTEEELKDTIETICNRVCETVDRCSVCGEYIIGEVRQNKDEEIVCEDCFIDTIFEVNTND